MMAKHIDDLNDPIDDLLGSPARPAPVSPPSNYTAPTFTERCPRCGGSGTFRNIGPCFACKGTGTKSFKTPREQRVKARANANARREKTAASRLDEFKSSHPEIFAWLDGNTFAFAVAMREAVERYGHLTDKQEAACLRLIAKRDAAKAAADERVSAAKTISLDAINAAFASASSKLKKPRLTVAGLVIYPAKADSPNAGALYVRSRDRVYLGKIVGGRFIRSRECTAEQETNLLEVAQNPKDAAIKYGRMTGSCAICNRPLEAGESIARGIGPVCAERFGW